MNKFIIGACFIVGSVVICRAQQPDCVTNRHMDQCGQVCPIVDPPPDPTTTTTTTLVGVCDTGESCVCAPNSPNKCADGKHCSCETTTTTLPGMVCPPVTCGPTTVNVEPCPAPPSYIPCRIVKKHGQTVIKCPKPDYRGRVLMPFVSSAVGAF